MADCYVTHYYVLQAASFPSYSCCLVVAARTRPRFHQGRCNAQDSIHMLMYMYGKFICTTATCVAGRQRLQLDLSSLGHGQDLSQASQTIKADIVPSYVPREAQQQAAYWQASIWQRFDAFQLAKKAATLFCAMAPKAGDHTFLQRSFLNRNGSVQPAGVRC